MMKDMQLACVNSQFYPLYSQEVTLTDRFIGTHGGRGGGDAPAHTRNHAIIHTTPSPPFDPRFTMTPIRVNPYSPGAAYQLNDKSRLNYSKVYTIEHNIKVMFIGEVAKESKPDLKADFERVFLQNL
jgi:hypothetical protein